MSRLTKIKEENYMDEVKRKLIKRYIIAAMVGLLIYSVFGPIGLAIAGLWYLLKRV